MARSLCFSPRPLIVACAVILGLLLAAPAAHAEDGGACPGDVLERPFAPWGDTAQYTLAPDGDFTDGAAGWDLDGAELVADNEPWYVHGGDTAAALRLRSGDRATTPPICVTLQHPAMRFFVRDGGGALGSLTVEVLFGGGLSLPIGVLVGLLQDDQWAPSPQLPIVANLLDDEVRFRFTAGGLGGAWVIDDVYVDPYGKG